MFRYVIGSMYVVIALIFLTVNSYILGSFGWKWGDTYWAQVGFAAVAAAVPWALAPHLHVMAAKRRAIDVGRRRTLGSRLAYGIKALASMVPFIVIYLVFVAYNVVGGTGATAFQRTKMADDRKQVIDETDRLKKQRKALQDQLDAIPKHRPASAVTPILESTKLHFFWRRTEECTTNVTNRSRRDFCAEVAQLKAELANSVQGDKILAEIKDLDSRLSEDKRSTSSEDPQVEFLAQLSGYDKRLVFLMLMLSTPLMLEVGALYFGKHAIDLFGLHLDMTPHPTMVPVERQIAPAPIMPQRHSTEVEVMALRAVDAPMSGDDPRRMRAVFDEFWTYRTKKVDGAQSAEVAMYEHYRTLCAERSVSAFSIERFRIFAADLGVKRVVFSGQYWYHGVVFCEEVMA